MPTSDHHAKLVIHKLSALSTDKREELAEWLEAQASVVRSAKPDEYAAVYTARLMK